MSEREDPDAAAQAAPEFEETNTMLPDTNTGSETDLMKELDSEYRDRSGLTERRHYSIFYSRIPPSPLMILGINPGGNPATWTMPADADEFCSASVTRGERSFPTSVRLPSRRYPSSCPTAAPETC